MGAQRGLGLFFLLPFVFDTCTCPFLVLWYLRVGTEAFTGAAVGGVCQREREREIGCVA